MAASFNETFDRLIDQIRAANPASIETLIDESWDLIRSPLAGDVEDKAAYLISLSDAIQEAIAE